MASNERQGAMFFGGADLYEYEDVIRNYGYSHKSCSPVIALQLAAMVWDEFVTFETMD